jgi:hypothetical protein
LFILSKQLNYKYLMTALSNKISKKIITELRNFVVAGIAIFAGGIIYIFFRSSKFIFFRWICHTGLNEWLDQIRLHSLNSNNHIPGWIIFSLPDGLWAFAYALIITSIWKDSRSWIKYIWYFSIPILVLGFEFLQLAGIVRGTFCIQDIVLGIAGLFIGILTGLQKSKQFNYENENSIA